MKPEIGYPDLVIESCMDTRLRILEWTMDHTALLDPYFEHACLEKFALETLLQEINDRDDVSPTEIIEEFAQKADKCIQDNPDRNSVYTFSVSRDAAMSILDEAYLGFWHCKVKMKK